MARSIVVVGAGVAALRAVERLRGLGWTDEIHVIGDEELPPYQRPPLSKRALMSDDAPAHLPRKSDGTIWTLGTRVVSADIGHCALTLDDGSSVDFTGLVVATGVRPRRLQLDAPLRWRHTLRTPADAASLRVALTKRPRVVVLGAGFLGLEVASAARALGCSVSVVEPAPGPLWLSLGPKVGEEVRRTHAEQGVDFRFDRAVTSVDCERDDEDPYVLHLDDGTSLSADVVVEAVGCVPNTEWLAGNGLDLSKGVLCDDRQHPVTVAGPLAHVVAAGDVARFPLSNAGAPMRIEHWTFAAQTAATAAGHLAEELSVDARTGPTPASRAARLLPSFWSDQYDLELRALGVPAAGVEDVRVLEGRPGEGLALGYYQDGVPVGVATVRLPPFKLAAYRDLLEQSPASAVT